MISGMHNDNLNRRKQADQIEIIPVWEIRNFQVKSPKDQIKMA